MNNEFKLALPRSGSFLQSVGLNGKAGGFTVMEMLVAIGIAAVITTTALASYPQFSRRLAVEREAQLLALALRDAEERSIRTQRAGIAFTAPFGVHFDLANPRQYILFADTNLGGNVGFYDVGEEIEIVSMGNSVRLDKLCADEKQGVDCTTAPVINSLSITFKRPAPLIEVQGVTTISGGSVIDLGEPDFEIYVRTEDGAYRQEIVVWTTGAISIED